MGRIQVFEVRALFLLFFLNFLGKKTDTFVCYRRCRCGDWVHWGSCRNIPWPAILRWFPWGLYFCSLSCYICVYLLVYCHISWKLCLTTILSTVLIQVKVVLRADVTAATYDKVAIISGLGASDSLAYFSFPELTKNSSMTLGPFYAQFEYSIMQG